jgi:fermentation-respiration switch protein FrsA (DUF1100 family)
MKAHLHHRIRAALVSSLVLSTSSCLSLDPFFFNPTRITDGDYTLNSYPAGFPEQRRIPMDRIERLTLTAADGTTVYAAFARQPDARSAATVLYHHGNASNIDGYWPRAAILYTALGVNVLVYDYPGYGRTPGRPSEEGIYASARAALAYLRSDESGIDPNRIFHYGFSLGGGPATQMAWESLSAGLILEATFTSVMGLAADSGLVVPSSFLMSNRFDNKSKIRIATQRAARGLLALHGTDDDFVQPRYSRELWETTCRDPIVNRSTLVLIEGADHGHVACSNQQGDCLPAADDSLYITELRRFVTSTPPTNAAQRVCSELPMPSER